jgi:hypothetical protein
MTVKQMMTKKPTEKVKDRFSGAEFTVSELTPILSQMVVNMQGDDAANFADRFEPIESK